MPMTETPPVLTEKAPGRAAEPYRTAVAVGTVTMDQRTLERIENGSVPKGHVLEAARIAGVIGAKETSRLIPLCLDVHLLAIELDIRLDHEASAVRLRAFAKSQGSTGVEMEALTAVSVAALTIYDMCKSLSRDIKITDVHLLAKTGGQSGDYLRESVSQIEHS